jgi:hypothetical protein
VLPLIPPEGGSYVLSLIPPEGGSYVPSLIPPEGGSYERDSCSFRLQAEDYMPVA